MGDFFKDAVLKKKGNGGDQKNQNVDNEYSCQVSYDIITFYRNKCFYTPSAVDFIRICHRWLSEPWFYIICVITLMRYDGYVDEVKDSVVIGQNVLWERDLEVFEECQSLESITRHP